MVGTRTRLSLGQLLEHFAPPMVSALLVKFGGPQLYQSPGLVFGQQLYEAVQMLDGQSVMALLDEVVTTQRTLRQRSEPRYVFDERFHDLVQCLRLDGYQVTEDRRLLQLDPTLSEAPPVEDDLVQALRASGAPSSDEMVRKINDSAEAFRRATPDYNAALTNARVALETLARDVALETATLARTPFPYNPSKWGDLIRYLRERDEISPEEERGLIGVYGFVSPGAHRPIGLPLEQMTRLGRTLALNMCWFLLQNRNAQRNGTARS